MWLLINDTPFSAESTWVRDRDGAEVWLVAVKCSFTIQSDGRQVLHPVQTPVSRAPVFRAEPERSSLIQENDLVHTKLKTDVLLYGDAHAPNGRAVHYMDVRLKVATIDKTLRVYGDRRWVAGVLGPSLTAPEPFTRVPIVYERAFGGTDMTDAEERGWEPRNPVGTGFALKKEHIVGKLSPNVEDPRRPCVDWRKGHPAGFGPIARHWAPRVALAGTYDDVWERTRKPLVPTDFDDRFHQCAPEDQQVEGFLKGGEFVELHGMTADGVLSFHLPRITLVMTTEFYDGSETQHRPVLHTLSLFPEERSFQIVWHSHLPCHQKVNELRATQIVRKRRVNVPSSEVASGMWIGPEIE
jgi:hypothetical protein